VSEVVAYETNPSTSSSHKGDTSFEQNAYLSWSKKLTPTLTWMGTYYGTYLQYVEYHAGDYTDTSGSDGTTPTRKRGMAPGRKPTRIGRMRATAGATRSGRR